jgi:4'-phosphopantetheinyl transferase
MPRTGNHGSEGAGTIVEVWVIRLDVGRIATDRLRAWLSQDELARAAGFHFDRDRSRYIVAHGAVRAILGERLGLLPQQVAFEVGPHGKPRLAAEDPGIRFNLSHSGGIALCAVTGGVEVGVDVEALRVVPDAEAIARRFFANREVEDWLRLSTSERPDGFLRLWSCKEAWIKACGMGLSMPMDLSEIGVSGDSAWLHTVHGSPLEAGRWTLRTFDPAPSYVGAACVEAPEMDLRVRTWAAPWPEWEPQVSD